MSKTKKILLYTVCGLFGLMLLGAITGDNNNSEPITKNKETNIKKEVQTEKTQEEIFKEQQKKLDNEIKKGCDNYKWNKIAEYQEAMKTVLLAPGTYELISIKENDLGLCHFEFTLVFGYKNLYKTSLQSTLYVEQDENGAIVITLDGENLLN